MKSINIDINDLLYVKKLAEKEKKSVFVYPKNDESIVIGYDPRAGLVMIHEIENCITWHTTYSPAPILKHE